MFKLENDILRVELPEGKTQGELIALCAEELKKIESACHGLEIKINGRLTTGMSLFLGHKLAHICKSVAIYDPKEGVYFRAVWH
jgi:hypothetical protein